MARTRTWLVQETIVRTAIVVVVGAIVSGLGSGSALAQPSICDAITGNLVKNCGFETGDFTDWTTIPAVPANNSNFGVDNRLPNSGTYAAFFEATGTFDDTITQTLTTTLGSHYTVNFWLTDVNTFPTKDNDFHVSWGLMPLLDLVNANAFPYTEYTFTVTGTGADVLRFAGREVPSAYLLDDVSVTVAAVPEPATLFLLGSGLAGLAAWRHAGGVRPSNRTDGHT